MTSPTIEEISATLSNHPVFVVIAETLDGWMPPTTPEGRKVLHAHYLWAKDLHDQQLLLLAGPMNMGNHSPAGLPTGLIILHANSQAQAEELAFKDPLHLSGFRKNTVHPWSIRWEAPEISKALDGIFSKTTS